MMPPGHIRTTTASEPPVLLLIGGPPGSGKSTLARTLARTWAVPLLDKDTVKSTLLAMDVDEAVAGRASYELLVPLAADMLRLGIPVILDAPGKYPQFLDACQQEAVACSTSFRCILCYTDVEVRRDRLRHRASLASQWTTVSGGAADTIDEWRAHFPNQTLVLESTKELVVLARQAATWLGWQPSGTE